METCILSNFDKFKNALKMLKEGECLYTKVGKDNVAGLYKYTREGQKYLCNQIYTISGAIFYLEGYHSLKDTLQVFISEEEVITEKEANIIIMMKELEK